MNWRYLAVVTMVVIIVLGTVSVGGAFVGNTEDGPQRISFKNVTDESGVDYIGTGRSNGNGNNGVYANDVDNDGWTDLLVVGGAQPALFRNEGGKFERETSFPNVTRKIKSATFLDYDGDGWDDIVLFVVRGEPIVLRNVEGEFERLKTNLGLGNLTYPLGATTADYDGDGDYDLLVYQSGDWAEHRPAGFFNYSNMTHHVVDDNGNPNVLYRNTGGTGNDRFERVEGAGIEGDRWSLAASFIDLNSDGQPDVHVANDFNNDVVYLNQGDGTFEKRLLGAATARNGMSSETGDFNGDGQPDVFVTNIYLPIQENRGEISDERYSRYKRYFDFIVKSGRTNGNTLLINQGNGEFVDRADEYGVRKGGWGWAASFADFDNDGMLDLVQSTQYVVRLDPDNPRWTYPMVWQGHPDNTTFTRVKNSTHGIDELDTRGMVALDYDNDGDLDLAMATYYGPVVLYENTAKVGSSLQFEVVNENGATTIGATVTVETEGWNQTFFQTDESDFMSQESRFKHVGLGDAESATLTVTWSDGTERKFEVKANQRLQVTKDGVKVVANFTRGLG